MSELGSSASDAPSNRVLCEVVRCIPRTATELRKCRGVGTVLVEKFGEALLDAVRRLVPQAQPTAASGKKRAKKRGRTMRE